MSALNVTLYDPNGFELAEIDADVQSVLWRLEQTGNAILSADYRNPKTRLDYLRPGNRLRVQFSNGLPDWAGVIDWPRSRRDAGVSVTAYEADRLVSWRHSAALEEYAAAPGAIAAGLLAAANGRAATGIERGGIWTGGPALALSYRYQNLRDAWRALGYEYAVTPLVQGGRLTFAFDWYERRGADRRDAVLLAHGLNVGAVTLDEQGPVTNYVIAVGAAGAPVVVSDAGSVVAYGRRELVLHLTDITDATTLTAQATAALTAGAQPQVRATLHQVVDRDPAGFAAYDVGDIVTLEALPQAGDWSYTGAVRILAREWQPDDTCTLEVAEWTA